MEAKKTISGNWIVDEISKMHINSIPQAWYKTIRQKKTPHAMAILVLWELIYWYKWTEIRDEQTDRVIGYKKKFKADLLQRSYADIAAKFGISKRQATDIISFLKDEGIINTELKTITVNGMRVSNVLFIGLNPEKIAEISDEQNIIEADNGDSTNDKTVELSTKNDTNYHEISVELSTVKRDTNTTITQSNSQTNSQSLSQTEQTCESSESTQSNSLSDKDSNSKSHCGKATKSKESFPRDYYTQVYNAYFANYKILHEQGVLENERPVLNYKATNSLLNTKFTEYGFENVLKAVRESINHHWLTHDKKYDFKLIFGPNELPNLINGTYQNFDNQTYNKPSYQRPQKQWTDDHLIL